MRAGFSTCVGLAMAIVSAVAAADPGPSKPADSEHLESVAMLQLAHYKPAGKTKKVNYKTTSELVRWAEKEGNLRRPTATGPLKLKGDAKGYHGQYPGEPYQQDKYVDDLLQHKKHGFVVEAGANNGESLSNSLFFEVSRNWRGLLVEPNPEEYKKLLGLNRQMWALRGGLSTENAVSSFDFVPAGFFGGIESEIGGREKREIEPEQLKHPIQVTCYPLHEILQGIGEKTVDYWSLDTEGSEPAILEATDFDAIEVGVLGVEHNGDAAKKDRIARRMKAIGFKLNLSTFQDDIYVNPGYFKHNFP